MRFYGGAGRITAAAMEGDEVLVEVDFSHPGRWAGERFTYELTTSDGTTKTGEVRWDGTSNSSTILVPVVLRDDGPFGATACVTAPGGARRCFTDHEFATVLPAGPVVHPADLTTWTNETVGRPGEMYAGGANDWVANPGGYSGMELTNINFPALVISDQELIATEDDPARISFDMGSAGGDDDLFGLALGLQSDEVNRDDADWLLVGFFGHAQEGSPVSMCDAPGQSYYQMRPETAVASRFRGYGHYLEYMTGTTLDVPGAADDLVQRRRRRRRSSTPPGAAGAVGPGRGRLEAPGPPEDLVYPQHQIDHLYRLDVTYSPRLLVVEMDGIEVLRAEAPADDPFPMGKVALVSQSQPATRLIGHTQVPTVEVDQGEDHTFRAPFADADLTASHDAVIDWGDGSPASAATITADGEGRWVLAADHAYARAGEFVAEACVRDLDDLLTGCGQIIVKVANVAPTVDAGRDRTSGAEFSLDGAFYTDPGTLETHTATIDWGDGTPVEPATIDGRPGTGIVNGDHTYAGSGTYTVRVCVTDEPEPGVEPLTGCDTREIEVKADPVAPEAMLTDGPTGPEGTTVELGVGFTDENPDPDHTVTVDWGDGTAPATVEVQDGGVFGSGFAEHTYADDGTFTATVSVCGSDDVRHRHRGHRGRNVAERRRHLRGRGRPRRARRHRHRPRRRRHPHRRRRLGRRRGPRHRRRDRRSRAVAPSPPTTPTPAPARSRSRSVPPTTRTPRAATAPRSR